MFSKWYYQCFLTEDFISSAYIKRSEVILHMLTICSLTIISLVKYPTIDDNTDIHDNTQIRISVMS